MKNKIKIGLFALIILGVITLCLTYKGKNNIGKTKKQKQSNLAIMIKEDGANDYTMSSSKDIPKGDYVLNYEKSYCKNNGKIGNYDNALGKVSFSFIGTDSCYLYFDYNDAKIGYQKILLDNGLGATTVEDAKQNIESKGTPDFSKIADTDEGMFAAADDYTSESGMKSFYYRGAISNNWLKYGKYAKDVYYYDSSIAETCPDGKTCTKMASSGDDIYWRIIRVNGDGSIRLLWSGEDVPTEETKVVKLDTDKKEYYNAIFDSTAIRFESFANTYTNIFNSDIFVNSNLCQGNKMYWDIELYSEVTEYGNDSEICNAGGFSPYYMFPITSRLNNNNPSFVCQTNEQKIESKYIGLSGDELISAGLNANFNFDAESGYCESITVNSSENKKVYLYNGIDYLTKTYISLLDCTSNEDSAGYKYSTVSENGGFNYSSMMGGYKIRPVISLSKNVKLTGNGTWNNVYTVVE